MGRPLEITGYIMSSYVEDNQYRIKQLQGLIWGAINKHADNPEFITTLTEIGKSVDSLSYSTMNQRAIIDGRMTGDWLPELERLIASLKESRSEQGKTHGKRSEDF